MENEPEIAKPSEVENTSQDSAPLRIVAPKEDKSDRAAFRNANRVVIRKDSKEDSDRIVLPQEDSDRIVAPEENSTMSNVPATSSRTGPPEDEKESTEEASESLAAKLEKRSIIVCDRFTDFYELGEELEPSSKLMEELEELEPPSPGKNWTLADGKNHYPVRRAKRISDGLEVVVKKRDKARGHGQSKSKEQEEQEWVRSAEMLLNLPASENIAHLYDILEDEKHYYVVMEKAQGCDLAQLIQSGTRIGVKEAVVILYRLLQAVQDLHSTGCIHKDLKLENVMIDSPTLTSRNPWSKFQTQQDLLSTTFVKLIDFDTTEPFSPKRAKRVVGTDQYIPQEAYAGHYSPASDVFSVGVIAYRLICGKFPFWNFEFDDNPGENQVGSVKMMQIRERLKAFDINFDTHPWSGLPVAKELVSWMLKNNESDRPTVEQALAHHFFENFEEEEILSAPGSRLGSKRPSLSEPGSKRPSLALAEPGSKIFSAPGSKRGSLSEPLAGMLSPGGSKRGSLAEPFAGVTSAGGSAGGSKRSSLAET